MFKPFISFMMAMGLALTGAVLNAQEFPVAVGRDSTIGRELNYNHFGRYLGSEQCHRPADRVPG